MRRICLALRSKKGYALLAVLCVLLVFAVMGTNTLVAASAGMGTVSKKLTDSQAYVLSSSALPYVGRLVEQGKFNEFVKTNLLDKIESGTSAEDCTASLTAVFTLPNARNDSVNLVLDFFMEDASVVTSADHTTRVTGMLVVRVTAVYEEVEYSYLIDFSQIVDPAAPTVPGWRLHSYRTSRI